MTDSIGDIEYDIKLSINYHRKRESFYRTVDAAAKAVSLIALASIGFDANHFTMAAAILSGSFTIATIVVDCPGMAGRHGGLANRFYSLLGRVVQSDDDPETVKQARSEYHAIGSDEPPQLRGLVQLCQDEQDAADNKYVDPKHFSMWRRVMAQFGFGQRPIDFGQPKSTV